MARRSVLCIASFLLSCFSAMDAYLGIGSDIVHDVPSTRSRLCFTPLQQLRLSTRSQQRALPFRPTMTKSGDESEKPTSQMEAQLKQLLSRRKVLFSAASVGAAGLIRVPKSQAAVQPDTSATVRSAAESVPGISPIIGEYNKAPGKRIVFPDGLVEKSPSDKYAYRALTLPNGLRVLLASDPKVFLAPVSRFSCILCCRAAAATPSIVDLVNRDRQQQKRGIITALAPPRPPETRLRQ